MAIETSPVGRCKRCFTRDEVVARIRSRMVGRLRTQGAFAKSIGISQPMLSQIINKERMPSEELLKRFGLVFVEHFEDIG